jgi:uncharacterized damage-inducible protein DinB
MGELMHFSSSISVRLTHQHETIKELCDGLSEEQLKKRIVPGKWSCFENIAHLAAYQPLFLNRLERIMEEQEPTFERYVAEQDPLFFTCLEFPLDPLKDRISTDRSLIINKMSGFSQTEIVRTARHPKFGNMTVSEWTEFFLLHEAHHLYTIFMLTRELR